MNVITTIVWINKVAFPLPFLILILQVLSFMMFSGDELKEPFYSDFINWGQTLIILGYNIGDTLKTFQSPNFDKFISRFAFFYTYIEMAYGSKYGNWISYLNIFLFGTLNRFIDRIHDFKVRKSNLLKSIYQTSEDFVKEKIVLYRDFRFAQA